MEWKTLGREEQEIVLDIRDRGPDCAKFLSRRHNIRLRDTMDMLGRLEKTGWLERVKGTFLFKKGLRKPKHMNHTYYKLSRQAVRALRGL